jgi:hypothetical protein
MHLDLVHRTWGWKFSPQYLGADKMVGLEFTTLQDSLCLMLDILLQLPLITSIFAFFLLH